MILKEIYLQNWKLFREPVTIEFTDGINIIYGDNEAGKSTLINSLHTVFFNKYKSQSDNIKSLKPWKTELSPNATIEFTNNDLDYKITKKFLKNPKSSIKEYNGDSWILKANGAKSDEMILDIFKGKFSSSRGKKINKSNWGIVQSLWMTQGDPIIDEKEEINPETVSGLGSMLNASIESPDEKNIVTKIDKKYESIFGKKNTPKPSSELNTLKKKIEELKTKLTTFRGNVAEKEELMHKMENDETQLEESEEQFDEVKEKLKQLEKDIEEARKHELERQKIEGDLKEIKLNYDSLREKFDDFIQLKKENYELNLKNNQLVNEKDVNDRELSQLSVKLKKCTSNSEMLKDKIDKIDNEKILVNIAKNTIQQEIRINHLRTKLEELKELNEELIKKDKYYKSIISPSLSDLKSFQNKYNKIMNLKAQLEAIGLTIRGHGNDLLSGKISLDGKISDINLSESESNWNAHQNVKIFIDDVCEFEIKSGSQDVQDLQNSLIEEEIEYNNFLAAYKCKDLNELNDIFRKKEAAKTDYDRINERLNKKFENGEKSLILEINELKSKIDRNWGNIPQDSPYNFNKAHDKSSKEEFLSEKIHEIERNVKKLKIDLKTLEEVKDTFLKQQKQYGESLSHITNKIFGNNQVIDSNEKRIINLGKMGIDEKETQKQLSKIALESERKEIALKALQGEIEDKEKKPKEHYNSYESRYNRLDNEIQLLKRSIFENEIHMKNLLSTFDDANTIEEELKCDENKRNELEIEYEAIKLLYDINHHFRQKTINSLTNPIQSLVSDNLKKLVGPKYYTVELDENLKPDSVVTNREEIADLYTLSFGTQEQIWCLFRLAMGKLLSDNEKQLVVLDDPFVNTDRRRMKNAIKILEDSAKDLQIILLTCNIQNYDLISNANIIPLGKSGKL